MKKASDGAEEPDPGSPGEEKPTETPGSKEENDPKPTKNSDVLPEADAALCPDPGQGQQGISAVAVLWTFGKCLSALLPVYLCGYYRVSTGLLVCGMMVYTGWKHAREAKEHRWRSAVHLASNEEHTLSKNKKDLPAWVNFPDVEKVEWLNKVLQQVWPFVGQYLEKLLVETIAPSIRGSSAHLQTLTFTKVDFGDKPMKVVGIKAHTENDKGQVLLDVYISYVGNVEIDVEVKRYFCKAGVKGIQLHGMMRVILEPLIGDVPIVGAVTMFFIRRPKLDINWTGLTNLLDIPGLNIMSDSVIMDAIASFLVLPNRLTVPLVPDLHVAQLRFPLPRGVVRIHLVEASDLPSKDNYVRGMLGGMSDPYALLRVGPQTFTSKTVDNTLSPAWGEIYEVVVHEVPGQELEVEVYDKDSDQDDFLGKTKMDLGIVRKSIVVDDWFTLKDTKSGRVHLRMEWLKLLPDTDRLDEVLLKNSSVSSKSADPPSAAILIVYLDKAESLPMKKGNKDPNPMVQLSVQDITKESKTCWTTVDPAWEEAFTFFIQDPRKQDIDIQVKDSDRVQTLGSLTIPMSRLLSSPALTLDQWFQLDQAGPASRIYIKTVLRVLWLDEEKMSAVVSSKLEAGLTKQLPQNTHPHPSFSTEGLLRIHLLAGQNLVPKDNMLGGMVKGKSDPYVNINIGGETFTSHVIKSNLNPVWNEMYEVVLTDLPGQDLHLELLDKDMDMKDDFMGRLKISLKDIISSQYTDQWYNVCDVKSGRVHLVLEWVPKSTEAEGLDQVLHFLSRQSYHNKTVPSAGLLFVYVERADGLPLKKSGKEPKVGAEIILHKTSHKTTVCDRTTSPQWNEAFYFLVRDPREDMLIIKLSHSWTLPIGSVVVPLRELLSEPQLVLDQWLNLDGASPDSQILLRAELKMLIPTKCPVVTVKSNPPPTAPEPQTDLKQRSSSVDTPAVEAIREPEVPFVHRSSSVDTPAVEAIMEPEVGELQAEVEEVLVKELQESAALQKDVKEGEQAELLQPPHTSPDVSFGSEGFLRLHLLEAQKLVAKDSRMGGKGKSDPYVKVNVGSTTFTSHVIKENLNPVWNEMHEVVLRPQLGLVVKVELYDQDMGSDDFLGRVNISLADIIQSQYTDQWFPLSDVKSGQIHLVLEWVPTVSTTDNLDQVLQLQTVHSFQNKAVPTAALLQVFLERAHCLPLKKSGKEPKGGAELVFGDTTYRTKVCGRTKSPQWNEAFHFLVRDPKQQMLIIKLSSAWDQPLGSLVLPVRELLSEPQLVLDQWFHLDGASPDSQILLRAELKILQTRMIEALEAQPSEDEVTTTVVSAGHQSEDEVTTTVVSAGHQSEEEATTTEVDEATTTEVDEVTTAECSAPSSRELEEPADRGTTVTPMGAVESETSSQPEPDDEGEVDEEPPLCQPADEPHRPDGGATVTPPPPRETAPTCTPPEETPPAESQEELQPPTQRPHIGDDLAQATVPFDLPSPEQTLPPHTTPELHFATEGVLRIHLLEARSLVAKDNWGLVKGKSDPYVKVSVGDLMNFKSHVIKENLNPVWNEMYEVVVSGQTVQEIRFEVYDKDLDSDDFLGRFSIRLDDIIRPRYTDQWYTLKDVKSGQVHVVVEWVPAVSQNHRLEQVLQLQRLQSFQNRTVPSAALLFVLVDQARALPLKKSGKEPKAGAELVLGGTTHRTKMCDRSVDPQWKQTFYFLVRDPKLEMLIFKLSSGWDQPLGSLVLPVRELLSEPQLVLDQWFHLDGASPDSQILLRAELKILDSKMVELIGTDSLPCAASGCGP